VYVNALSDLYSQAKRLSVETDFNFDVKDNDYKTIDRECFLCANNYETVNIYKNNEIID